MKSISYIDYGIDKFHGALTDQDVMSAEHHWGGERVFLVLRLHAFDDPPAVQTPISDEGLT